MSGTSTEKLWGKDITLNALFRKYQKYQNKLAKHHDIGKRAVEQINKGKEAMKMNHIAT